MHAQRWTVITVSHNSAKHLSVWLPSDLAGAQWVVVDNASSDESVAVASERGAHVIPLEDNEGFSRANNRGLEIADTDYVMFVNPDVRVVGHELGLLEQSLEGRKGLIAPQLLNPDGSLQSNARGFPYLRAKVANRGVRGPSPVPNAYTGPPLTAPTYIAWAMGAAVGGRTQYLSDLGGWDSQYFLYYEDHDLGLRSWCAGGAVIVDPRVKWTHSWQRATAEMSAAAWKFELSSMSRFYRAYPFLLSRRIPLPHRFDPLRERLWQTAA
ncbi:glycosyltransferase [Nocardioides sp. NPDC092400]|uniref:glycosyltransferase n=1 Tax=Nocardioides sp. NPDC092400 TaxID=3155196 RepID=UPI003418290B